MGDSLQERLLLGQVLDLIEAAMLLLQGRGLRALNHTTSAWAGKPRPYNKHFDVFEIRPKSKVINLTKLITFTGVNQWT